MKLKSLLLILPLLLTLNISASDSADKGDKKGKNFEKHKAMAIEQMDKRISAMQKNKDCVSSASDRDALKACRKQAKAANEAFREDMKKRREARKERRKNRKKNK
tara:strand:- start:405324 stop:405638 length:315 start_codon:yes stop_codon:yes gene_type:complete